MPLRAVLISFALTALLLPAAAQAAEHRTIWQDSPTPIVRVEPHGKAHVLIPVAATIRAYHARVLEFSCWGGRLSEGGSHEIGGDKILHAGLRVRIPTRLDFCLVVVRERKGTTTHRWRQIVAITPAGEAYVARMAAVVRLANASGPFASAGPDGRLSSAAAIVAQAPPSLGLFALGSPEEAVPAGKVGLWTDEGTRLRLAVALADGTQLFYDYDSTTHVLMTNMMDELQAIEREPSIWLDRESVHGTSTGKRN